MLFMTITGIATIKPMVNPMVSQEDPKIPLSTGAKFSLKAGILSRE